MATAKRDGGLYYIGDQAVDANGVAVQDAPAKQPDTDPSKQPGALGAATPEERMGLAIAKALIDPKAALAAHGAQENGGRSAPPAQDDGPLPKVDELDAHLGTLTTVAEVKALQKRDERVTAGPKYDARIAELEGK